MRAALCLCAVLLAGTTPAYAQLPVKTRIITQADAPISITDYKASYSSGGRYSREGIQHEVKYRNNSPRPIIAVRLGLVSFDVWNEFLSKLGGFASDPLAAGKETSGAWVDSEYRAFTFMTGVAYVDKVRFADGEIWSANLDQIAVELKKIERDFDVQQLKAKEPPPIAQP